MDKVQTMRIKALVLAVFVTITGVFTGCSGRHSTAVVVAGSTSVQPYAEILAEEYLILNNETNIDVQGGGSSAGITAVESGIADIGMSSRSLKESEQHLWSVEIAKDGLAIIVNPKNPVNNLTLEQLRGIYSAEITNWKELGGADAKIHIISREEGSGTRSAFEELVMGQSRIVSKVIIQNSNGAMRQLVAGDTNSIGFISLGLIDSTVKALQLEGVEATRDNVIDGGYSLFRSFLFVAKSEPEGFAKKYIDFVFSPEGRNLLINEGLITE